MKKTVIYCLLLLLAGTMLHQCKPIDLTADYKDITVTYGLLNVADDIHYFKVYRGFLTDGNAYEAAGEWDNIYYPVDSIEVKLVEYRDGQFVREAVLDTTTVVPKKEGDFHNPKQLLYYSDWQLDNECVYRLVIRKKNTGKDIYAEPVVVGGFSVRNPMVSWNMNSENKYPIKFSAAENAAVYDLYLTFYYIEVNNATGAVEHKQLTHKINGSYIRATSTSEIVYTGFTPKTFFTTFLRDIETNPDVTRYIDSVDGKPYYCLRLTAWAANDTYLRYLETSTPGSSIVQNRMEYTNFVSDDESAYGIFASRGYAYRDLMMENTTGHSEDSLVHSALTRRLNFNYYRYSPEFPNGDAQ